MGIKNQGNIRYNNYLRAKKSVSALVATVLLILITVAATGIIWSAVMPMITKSTKMSEACLNARLNIDTTAGYTCYDEANKQVYVMVRRGAEDFNLSGIKIQLSGDGKTKGYNISLNAIGVLNLKFDEGVGNSVYDSSQNGNKGYTQGASWTQGIIGSALQFDGTDDFVNVSNSNSLNITGDLTIEIWIKPTSAITDYNHLIYKSGASYGLAINKSGYLMFWGNDTSVSNKGFESGTTSPTGWASYGATGNTRTTTEFHSGTAAGMHNDTSSAGSGCLVSPAINFEQNKTYKISYWYKPTGTITTARIMVQNAPNWGSVIDIDTTYTGMTPNVWQEVVFYYSNKNYTCKYIYICNGQTTVTGTVYYDDVSVKEVLSGNSPISIGNFSHVAIVFNDAANELKFYRNGVLDGSASLDDPIGNDNENLLIGKSISGHYFKGLMDELSIYPSVLSEDTIKKRYNGDLIYLQFPNINEAKTYVLSAMNITEASVAPVVKMGNTEKVCDVTSRVKIPKCI